VDELEKEVAESKAQFYEKIEQLGSANKQNAKLSLEVKELARQTKEIEDTANVKLAKMKSDFDDTRTSIEMQLDQTMGDFRPWVT
jgi:chromosome segregation ATPase